MSVFDFVHLQGVVVVFLFCCRATQWNISSTIWRGYPCRIMCPHTKTSCTAGKRPKASPNSSFPSITRHSSSSMLVGNGHNDKSGFSVSIQSLPSSSWSPPQNSIRCCSRTAKPTAWRSPVIFSTQSSTIGYSKKSQSSSS